MLFSPNYSTWPNNKFEFQFFFFVRKCFLTIHDIPCMKFVKYWNNGKNLDIGDTKRVAGENLDRFFSLKKTSYPNTIAKFFLFLSENCLSCIHPYYSKRNIVRFCRLEKSKKFGTWQKANARLSYCHEFENIPPSNKSIGKSMITTVSLQIPKFSHIFSWHCPLKFLNSLTVIGRIKTYFVSSKWK